MLRQGAAPSGVPCCSVFIQIHSIISPYLFLLQLFPIQHRNCNIMLGIRAALVWRDSPGPLAPHEQRVEAPMPTSPSDRPMRHIVAIFYSYGAG